MGPVFWNHERKQFEIQHPTPPNTFQRISLVNGAWKNGGSSSHTRQLLAENDALRNFVNSIERPIEPEQTATPSEPNRTISEPPTSPAELEIPLSNLNAYSQALESFRDPPEEPRQFDERLSELLDMANVVERLTQLEQSLAQKEAMITALQQNLGIATAELQAIRTTTPVTRSTSASKLDIPAPTKFEGKPYDVEPFLQRIENYFIATGNSGVEDQRKIAFAISSMEGNAIGWWIDLHHIEQATAAARGSNRFATWEDFKKALKSSFPDYNSHARAYDQFIGLVQGKTPTSAFIAKFKTLAARAKQLDEKNEANLILQFKRALRPNLLRQILSHSPLPTTIQGWYNLAATLDAQQQGIHYEPTGRGSGRLDEPMDIDRMSQEERKRHVEGGLCFKCHKKGHLSRDCPEKGRQRQGGGRGNQGNLKTRIGALFDELSSEEKAEFFDTIAKKDF